MCLKDNCNYHVHANFQIFYSESFQAQRKVKEFYSKDPYTKNYILHQHLLYFAHHLSIHYIQFCILLFIMIFHYKNFSCCVTSFFFFLYCSGFCHTLKWNSHGFTCVPHPDPLSHLPLYPIPLGLPSAPGPSACLMHPPWDGDLFHPR